MNSQDITRAIETRVAPEYGLWTIGITGNPDTRKETYKNNGADVHDWLAWPADSVDIARTVENRFRDEGMKGTEGEDVGNPTYVFIF